MPRACQILKPESNEDLKIENRKFSGDFKDSELQPWTCNIFLYMQTLSAGVYILHAEFIQGASLSLR